MSLLQNDMIDCRNTDEIMAVLSESDEPQGELGISNENFTASSSSSLSSSTSLEAVTAPANPNILSPRQWMESDEETNEIEADWSSNVSPDILRDLSVGEKKRQEIINEIYQTERNHVRTLRLLEGIFMRPLQEASVLSADELNLLFPPSLLVLKDVHSSFEQQLKQRRQDHGALLGDIGDLLLIMFDGRTGDELREHAAQFCARQQIALEALKEKRRKDENLQRLLTKAESHKACRRLQLKDLLPTALQRLTKYPLLFESLVKITIQVSPEKETEAQAIQRALDSSRRILNHVNQAVRIAEDTHKLQAIQKRLDKSSYDKDANNEFKNLDLTQYKLIYDGPLIMKKNPGIQLHGLLFESMMVLLIKQDDKYILKSQANAGTGSGENKSIEGRFNPITRINLIFVRQSAVEKNSFFLINTNVSQMLELTAPSSSECKTWFKHISETAEAHKARIKCSNDLTGGNDTASIQSNASNVKEHDNDGAAPERMVVSTSAAITPTSTVSQTVANNTINANNNIINNNQKSENDIDDEYRSGESSQKRSIEKSNAGDDARIDRVDNVQNIDDDTGKDSNKNVPPIYSNSTNSNVTRTLTQQSSLVAPSEISISISPSLTAEPVVTPSERLQRLDEAIRVKIAEKQKIVCDLFKVPNEHFAAIADIAGQPEASKDPTETVLAAFAQIQSLTEALNEYINVPHRQDITSITSSLCDDCHKTRNKLQMQRSRNSNSSNSSTATTVVRNTPAEVLSCDQTNLVQDDDGYCEIDEIRLPSIQPVPTKTTKSTGNPTKNPSSNAQNSKEPTIRSGDTSTATSSTLASSADAATAVTEISENEANGQTTIAKATTKSTDNTEEIGSGGLASEITDEQPSQEQQLIATAELANDVNDNSTAKADAITENVAAVCTTAAADSDEHIEINDAYDSISQRTTNIEHEATCERTDCASESCQKNKKESPNMPLIPCHLITTYVSALNEHISLLLPRLHERDIERDKLRRENQHLRDLLGSMHEREIANNDRQDSSENRTDADLTN